MPGSVMARRSSATRRVSERSPPSRRTRRGITPSSENCRIRAICSSSVSCDAAIADAHDLIAALQPGDGGGTVEPHLADHRLDDFRSDHGQNRIQQRGEQQVHGRPRQQHRDSMQHGPAGEGAMQLGRVHLAFALVQQFDVAAQGNRGHAVFGAIGVLADAHQHGFAEADAEAQNFEAEFLGDPVMTELVHGHQNPDRDQEGGEKEQHLHAKAPGSSSIKAKRQASRGGVGVQNIPQSLDGGRIETLQHFVNDRGNRL